MRSLVLALAAVSAIAAAGCSGPGDYLYNRGSDLGDVFVLRGGTGLGINATLKAGDLLHTGFGIASVHMFGYRGREPQEIQGAEMGFGIGHAEDFWTGPHTQVGEACYLFPFLNASETDRDRKAIDRFCIEVRATLGFVTFDFGLNPAELLDFLAGFSTLDFARDDIPVPARDPYGEEDDPYGDAPPGAVPPGGAGGGAKAP